MGLPGITLFLKIPALSFHNTLLDNAVPVALIEVVA